MIAASLYDAAFGVAAALLAAALRFGRLDAHRERLAVYPEGLVARLRGRPVVWVHNASVGELAAAVPLARALRARFPRHALLLSATSLAGRELGRKLAEADGACLLPLDSRGCVERALRTLHPSVFVFTETEIWPNLLRALDAGGVPAVLLSGRISPRAFDRYRRIREFLKEALAHVSLFGMQSEAEAERIRALGAPPERVVVTGSLKLDALAPPPALRIEGDGPVWVAGSTHPGEEEICLRALGALHERFPSLRMLLAPRHLSRLREVESLLRRSGVSFARRSRLDGAWRETPQCLLLDTLGELAGLYRCAAIAFVGGTLVPVGGHNLLEPARAAVPVLFGPHVESVGETARRLVECGGGRVVSGAEELESEAARLLADPELRASMGRAAEQAFARGDAVERSLEAAARFFP